MDEQFKNETFAGLRIKSSVARRFRKFARGMASSQSHTLDLMLDFFQRNKLSPKENLGPNMNSLEHNLKKRIDGFIAILRDIEKNQTKPTQAMLAALFEELPQDGKKPKRIPDMEDLIFTPTVEQEQSEPAYPEINPDLLLLLENLEYHQPSFSKAYYRLNLDRNNIEQLKQKYHVR